MAVWDCPNCLKHCDSPGELVQHLHDDHLYEESALPSESKGHRIRSTVAESSDSDNKIQYVCPFPNCTHTRQYTSKYNLLRHYFDHSVYTTEARPCCPNCLKRHKTLGSLTRHWEKSCRKKFERHGYTKAERQCLLRELNLEKKRVATNMDRALRRALRRGTQHAHAFGNNGKRDCWRVKPRENDKNNDASVDVGLALDLTQGATNDHASAAVNQLTTTPAAYDLAFANHGGVAAHDMRVMRSDCLPSSLRARTDQYTEQELPSTDISGLRSLSPQRLNESSMADYGESFVLSPPNISQFRVTPSGSSSPDGSSLLYSSMESPNQQFLTNTSRFDPVTFVDTNPPIQSAVPSNLTDPFLVQTPSLGSFQSELPSSHPYDHIPDVWGRLLQYSTCDAEIVW